MSGKVDTETVCRVGSSKTVSLSKINALDSIILTCKPADVLEYYHGFAFRKYHNKNY